MDERLQRTAAAVKSIGADWAVLTNYDSVVYATDHLTSIEIGISPFSGGPTTALVGSDGACVIVAPNVEADAARASRADEVVLYEGFTVDHTADLVANYAQAVAKAILQVGVGGVVAIEPDSFPAQLTALLGNTIGFGEAFRRARAVKTVEEKALMRRAAETAAIGQKKFRLATHAGRTEIDIFGEIRSAMEAFAGERLAIAGDFLSGRERTSRSTGWPIDRAVVAGDPIISDLAPRVSGYWGDSCASSCLGEPSAAYIRMFTAARSALDLAIEIARPGLVVADLDSQLRDQVGRAGYAYPHHSGHSIGTSVHEWPRLVPYERTTLEAGMFVMVEPGAYDPAVGGVRTEWMIEITADGCRPVAPFEHAPSISDV